MLLDDLFVRPAPPKRKSLATDIEVYCPICGKITTVTGATWDWPECCGRPLERLEDDSPNAQA